MKPQSFDFVNNLHTFALPIFKITSQFNGLIGLSTGTNQMTPTVMRLKEKKKHHNPHTKLGKLSTCNIASKLLAISTKFINKVTGS